MRRSDREIRDRQDILAVLSKCDVVRIGINTPDYPYIVPMNFGVETDGDSTTLWLHCASEGLKLNLIEKDPRIDFEADCSHKLIADESACNYTMEYESVIGCGNIRICSEKSDKLCGLKAVMSHYAPEREFDFPDAAIDAVCVLRLDIIQITGKRLQR